MRDKALQLLSLGICRLVDIGKSITTDSLHFERDKLKHEVHRVERSSFAFAPFTWTVRRRMRSEVRS